MTLILGLNAYHGDSAACLLKDGVLLAAAEEERFRRIKHWAGFPSEAILYCLKEAGGAIGDVDYVAVNRNPKTNLGRKIMFAVHNLPSMKLVRDRVRNALRIRGLKETFGEAFPGKKFRARIVPVQHHLAHLASSFFVSGMPRAALCSVDGFGDFVSTMIGFGEENGMKVFDQIYFPHSLGLFYSAITQYLGFPKYGDEYKVMGLSSYGKPVFMAEMRRLVRRVGEWKFELDLGYFRHHSAGVTMTWEGGEPNMGNVYSAKLVEMFGPARRKEDELTDRHRDIAASMQAMYEEAFFAILRYLEKRTGEKNLCLAGGCAMNSVANGKIFANTGFSEVYIQPAAGDGGGAIGAAYYVHNATLRQARGGKMVHAYLGPGYTEKNIEAVVANHSDFQAGLRNNDFISWVAKDENELLDKTAEAIIAGKVVGWFQGRMEWGPRALGNRSILVDPRRKDMIDILNARIKRRESFRPFAPVIVREAVGEYFETDYEVPFMLMVFKIRENKRSLIPAVTHVDNTGRLQTVTEQENPLYYRLIKRFGQKTGIPVLLNTSFNENEPIVNSPQEALDCFIRTKMDFLVLGNRIVVSGK
jgi:carbamoyltransferase